MLSFNFLTGLPSPGPHTLSSLAVQCSLLSNPTAFSTTGSPGWELFRLERKAGARTSSMTALARKDPTMACSLHAKGKVNGGGGRRERGDGRMCESLGAR